MGAIMRSGSLFSLLAAAFVCVLLVAPAQATLRGRVFVASYGSDVGTCTFGSPCKTFQYAVNNVALGGEVTAIDSAGFGPVIISQAVTITSPNGVEAGIAAAAGNAAVTINAGASDVVVLSGLTLEGAQSGAYGIQFNSGAKLEVDNCAIRNYTTYGIDFGPSGGNTMLFVNNTSVSDMGVAAIELDQGVAGSITAALNGVTLTNSIYGLQVQAPNGPVEVSVADSHIDNNLNSGIASEGGSSGLSSVIYLNGVTLNQTPTGFSVQGGTTAYLSQVTQSETSGIAGSVGIAFSGTNNTVYTDLTNHLMGGTTGTGSLTTLTLQ
jgi:hypothetical protein